MLYSLPLLALAFLISGSLYFYLRKGSFSTINTFSRQSKSFIWLSPIKKILSYSFISILLLTSLLIPLFMLVAESGFNFLPAIKSAQGSILNSLLVVGISVPIITLLGFLSYYVYKKSNFLAALIAFPLVIPSAVIGISLINLYSTLSVGIYGSVWMIVLGYILRFLPFSLFIFSAFGPQVSESMEESARMCKSGFMKTFYRIILPLTRNGFLASIFIISIFCIGETGMTQMVAPSGFQALSNRIDTLMHYGNYSYVASLSIFLLLFIFLLYGLYLVMYRHGRH
ncbi:MAG: hypothetical protein A2Y81_03460 [Nitrospirae bacterium RBG_13_43_8]|nr:MAG: hypothetical protein A2Y81_03460 [Nitrospirae bacterium RBG_13_43_8]